MIKTSAQEAYYKFAADKLAWTFGPWGNETKHFANKAESGSGSVKKEYMRLRDLAVLHPKMGNKTKFSKFKEAMKAHGQEYPIEEWEKEEPRTLTGMFGGRWGD